jgi:hypothetical protein
MKWLGPPLDVSKLVLMTSISGVTRKYLAGYGMGTAAAFVYCRTPQPVPRIDLKLATADIGLLDYEGAKA